jgi:hypothetical protein
MMDDPTTFHQASGAVAMNWKSSTLENRRRVLLAVLCLAVFVPATTHAQQRKSDVMVGAYYFDGWTAQHDQINKVLYKEYPHRQPVWGWKDDTVEIMQKQIDYCADFDIGFWAFDWYYPGGESNHHPCNNALGLYLKAPNRLRLKFCLMVANHGEFRIRPKDWDACCRTWIDLFRQPNYLCLDGQPLLIFFAPWQLEQDFGSADSVRKAFESLRAKAKEAHVPGVAIAACTELRDGFDNLAHSGYTLLTGYNYCSDGPGPKPFRNLIEANSEIFDGFARRATLPYIPVITTGWDNRPFSMPSPSSPVRTVWYPDRSPKLVEEFVREGIRWLDKHPDKTTPQRLLLLYAWNENGEGGYLTPTAQDSTEYLKAVQRGIREDHVGGKD